MLCDRRCQRRKRRREMVKCGGEEEIKGRGRKMILLYL